MTTERFKRPPLERDRPIRTWATLFGAPPTGAKPAAAEPSRREGTEGRSAPPIGFGAPPAGPLGDAVSGGYRVINEYMRQGQAFAQAFNPAANVAASAGGGAGGMPEGTAPLPADMQALAQRVMQYGWDFAGLWFELWSKMSGGANGWSAPAPPAPGANPTTPAESAPMPPQGAVAPATMAGRLTVSVRSTRSTRSTIELRSGPLGPLAIHPLRAEGSEAPAVDQVTIESDADGAVSVTVLVPPDQPPGVYNGLIVDRASQLPRGTFSLTVRADEAK